MRAVAIDRFGGPEVLRLLDLPDPTPRAGEVLLRVFASGINPVDWKIREGFLAQRLPHRFPLVPGWEAAGVIEAVGHGAVRFKRGDAVYAYTRLPEVQHGSYAELIALPEASVAPKPASLLVHEAAAVPLAGLTAYQALFGEHRDVGPGATVLVHAASGGVGHFAVQLAKNAGARVIGTAGKANQAFIRELGVDDAIDYTAGDFREAVRSLAPEGVDVAFDTVGGEVLTKTYDVVKKGGRLVGITAVPDQAIGAARGFTTQYHFVAPSAADLEHLGKLADAGKLRVHVSAIHPLAAVAEAQQQSREGRTRGKAVLIL